MGKGVLQEAKQRKKENQTER